MKEGQKFFITVNFSRPNESMPEKKGLVRGHVGREIWLMTQDMENEDVVHTKCIAHTDLGGNIPHTATNSLATKLCSKLMDRVIEGYDKSFVKNKLKQT